MHRRQAIIAIRRCRFARLRAAQHQRSHPMEKVTPPTAITVDKEVSFNNKRFSYEDLKQIAFLIKKAMMKFEKLHLNITFSLPDSLQRTDSFEIFEDVNFFPQCKIHALGIRCQEWGGDTLISVDIRHGEHARFSVTGEKNWVASTEAAIYELMGNVPPSCPRGLIIPAMLLYLISTLVFFFLFLFGIGFLRDLGDYWIKDTTLAEPLGGFGSVVYLVLITIMAASPASILGSKFIGLWPNIDIDTGPEHLKKEKIMRRWINKGIIILSIILPLILSVISLLDD